MKKPLPSGIPRTTRTLKTPWGDVEYRAWGLGDQSVLLQALTGDTSNEVRADALSQIMRSGVSSYSKGDVSEMPLFLAELVLLRMRALSIGEEATLYKQCPHCEPGKVEFKFNLEELTIQTFEGHKDSLTIGDYTFKFRYPSFRGTLEVGVLETLTNFSERVVVKFIESVCTEDEVYLMDDYTEDEQVEFVKDLGADLQVFVFEKFIQLMPCVTIDLHGVCDKCGEEDHQHVKGASKLFSF